MLFVLKTRARLILRARILKSPPQVNLSKYQLLNQLLMLSLQPDLGISTRSCVEQNPWKVMLEGESSPQNRRKALDWPQSPIQQVTGKKETIHDFI